MIGQWLVLPDCPDASRVLPVECLPRRDTLVAHASGALWLIGEFGRDELTLASVGSLRVAVIGSCPVTATRLTELVANVRVPAELDALARTLPGCFHLAASVGGVVRVQGSLAGLRAVFHAELKGAVVAGDRADVLARVIGAGVDERSLATRLVCGSQVPPPLAERSLWNGVRMLPPDRYLRIGLDGRGASVRWWHPPEPNRGLPVGAPVVREALLAAVAARKPTEGRLAADLSGGVDSTALCFLADQIGIPGMLTIRRVENETGNDDSVFAAHAAERLPNAEHMVLSPAELPGNFAEPADNGDTEAPYRYTRTLARSRHTISMLAAHGVSHHLAGHGGDEVFQPLTVAYLHPLLRRRPSIALAQLRGYRALRRWRLPATLSGLAGGGDLSAWWYRQARGLTSGPPPRRSPDMDWSFPLQAGRWATSSAVDIARAVLRSIGDEAQPLAADRGQHAALSVLRMTAPGYRQLAGVFAAGGISLQLPYLDDRVIEAALAVRPEERATPWRYKPSLVEAMRDILPESIAKRASKGEFSEDTRIGLKQYRSDILNFMADSMLAKRGLIDLDLLRRELLAPQTDNIMSFALENLLGCENWLRAATPLPEKTGWV